MNPSVPSHGLTAIAAMAANRVIGNNGRLPWRLPQDLAFFKRTTLGHTLVMGRRTFDSIGRPLPGRDTVVLSRHMAPTDGVAVVRDPSEVLAMAAHRQVFIAGGEEVYRLFLPQCRTLLLTHVLRDCVGDAVFPPFEEDFLCTDTIYTDDDCRIVRYANSMCRTVGDTILSRTRTLCGGNSAG